MDTSFSIANTSKRTEKDEKAISEIYKTLVTSFNPGNSFDEIKFIFVITFNKTKLTNSFRHNHKFERGKKQISSHIYCFSAYLGPSSLDLPIDTSPFSNYHSFSLLFIINIKSFFRLNHR